MLLQHLLFSIAFLLPLTLTIPPPLTNAIVSCLDYPTSPFAINDCIYLVYEMDERKAAYPWAHQSIIWGPAQAVPGKTPLRITLSTCRIEIQARYPRRRDTDEFKLADYFDALKEVLRVCFSQEIGRTGGVTPLGGKNLFHAYIGGIPTEFANGTIVS